MESILGIDVGTHSIKLIEIAQEKNIRTLLSAGSMPTPSKALSSTLTADFEAIAYVIKQLVKETGAKSDKVNIALPESQVFTRVIEVPQLSNRELTSAIQWEAEQYIPLPLDQVNMDFTILRDAKTTANGKMEVLLIAAPKALIERYMTILELADLVPAFAETEIIASARAIAASVSMVKNVMLVSIGAQTTDMTILHGGVIAFTRSISAGGEALSRALSQSLDFTVVQAEEYKKTYGLQKELLEGKLIVAMEPIMATIMNEIKRAIAFFGEKYANERIEAIVLSGGSAKLPGIVSFMTESVNIETQLANPWIGIQKEARFAVLSAEGPLFAVAVGLAIRS
ncbi:MAG: type IV pilus assembly protein PilM [Candidatus Gottesmanbacteria bacterium]